LTAEELEELKQSLDDGQLFDDSQCQALLAEVWRLKTMVTNRSIEARVAREEANQTRAALRSARSDSEALRQEISRLNMVGNVMVCELADRWSNCAMMRRKCAEEADLSPADASVQPKADPH
jgi:hypothetical protein